MLRKDLERSGHVHKKRRLYYVIQMDEESTLIWLERCRGSKMDGRNTDSNLDCITGEILGRME